MGVTVTPEICEECKLILRSAYAFRKKCLATENLIGSYLKKSRCNAASIELVAVLHFLEQQRKEEATAFQGKALEIISEWDDDCSQDSGKSNEISTQVRCYSLQYFFSIIIEYPISQLCLDIMFHINFSVLFLLP